MNTFGLSTTERELICGVLVHHSEVTEARIFGSRAKGNFQPSSDIDLAVLGNISLHTLAAIAGELEDLPMPYLFDIEAYDSIRYQPLRDHIDRIAKSFYVRFEQVHEEII
jgi:uncharacterized protein